MVHAVTLDKPYGLFFHEKRCTRHLRRLRISIKYKEVRSVEQDFI